MYNQHWGLTERPFENRMDTKFYYPAETHQAALLKLHYAIENRRSAAILCGSGGIGKSLIVDSLKSQLSDEFRPICHIVFPAMNSEQFVRYVVDKVDTTPVEGAREASSDLERFERFLENSIEAKRHPVVVVDEAHLLEQNDLLEPLRLMLNIAATNSGGESAWTLILAGQPSLLSHVERYHALDERLAVKCMLNRLLPEETNAYIQHRMRVAGVEADDIFEAEAQERIHLLTQGIPRRINRLCDLALMVGYAEDRKTISIETIDSVHNDLATPAIV